MTLTQVLNYVSKNFKNFEKIERTSDFGPKKRTKYIEKNASIKTRSNWYPSYELKGAGLHTLVWSVCRKIRTWLQISQKPTYLFERERGGNKILRVLIFWWPSRACHILPETLFVKKATRDAVELWTLKLKDFFLYIWHN